MRVEDRIPVPPPMPQQQPRMTSFEDERRLSLIREHGQQNTAPLSDHRFDYVSQANSFDGHRNFQDFSRPESVDRVLLPERRDFYGGGVESLRNRGEEKYVDRGSDERSFGEFRPSLSRDREFYLNESSSYRLPKQAQYPHSENGYMMHLSNEPQYPLSGSDHMMPLPKQAQYPHPEMPCAKQPEHPQSESNHMMPLPKQPQYPRSEGYHMTRTASDEQGSHHPPPYPNYGPPLENKFELRNEQITHFAPKPYVSSASHESNDYRMDSTLPGRVYNSLHYAPLPPHPPIPPPPEPSPPRNFQDKPLIRSPPPLLSPIPSTNSKPLFPTPPISRNILESRSAVQSKFYAETVGHTTGFVTEALGFIHQKPSKEYMERRGQTFPNRRPVKDEPTVIDACQLFKQPHRASRPDRIVVILRGLPGSGKSYLAKALRDLEVESGGSAPRIHAMDDYFMIEVEKVEENEGSKSSGSSRGKKQTTKKVIEYCYEPEMEEVYRSSMLKAFKKTLDEGNFTFIIVDDRNLRVADFAQFWAVAKRSGYEVYLLEATYKDPTGCAARNVHGFTVHDIQKMAEKWEEAPSLYLHLNIQSLFRGDNLNEQSIQEVDMDTDDAAGDEEADKPQQSEDMRNKEPSPLNHTLDGIRKAAERWNSDEEEEELTHVKDLGSSKWSKDVDEDIDESDGAGRNLNALSGLVQAYGKSEKSVHWGDQVEKSGFSIGAVKKQRRSSLIIGPGSGYNLGSNPLQEDDVALQSSGKSNVNESKRRFTEQLRAERESFKAVFDRRKQRIGGLRDVEDE
ncbi:uncharacterized protein LOC109827589 [Asparagus officinalis]|uniref:uncharacterized protein LOC109827589 n=1 Tax=Asparagus officinalis TaxID=4686 RepID=UPI00098E31BE|nr:uncharacterized protein LOC109827589 [Asparagus officinalis]